MQLRESAVIALDIIRTHKMRSFLTLLGVIIGMTSIIGMQSLIQGFQKNMKKQMEQLGSNIFQVQKYPAIQMGGHHHDQYRNRKDITMKEVDAIVEHGDLVTNIGPEVWKFGVIVKYKDKKTSPMMTLAGGVPAFFPNNGYYIGEGRALTDSDVQDKRDVIVIGMDVVDELFPFQSAVGENVVVDGHKYKVVGVLAEQGQRFGQSEDSRTVIPVSTFQKYYGNDESLNITVQVRDGVLMEAAQEQVASILRIVRKVPPDKPNDFEIWSSESLLESFNNMTRVIRIGAIVIVSFSLLVAGIGIMNIMLVSIRERTREIGVRMALGARRRDIMFQFLVEAVMLSLVGGVIGVACGTGIGQILSLFKVLPAAVPYWTIVIGFLFCSLVGLFFGLYPAQKASKMDPIESLRYE
jgi:putative ABC transport system permease protein